MRHFNGQKSRAEDYIRAILQAEVLDASGVDRLAQSGAGVITDWSDHKDGVDAVWCYAEWRCGKNGEAWNQLRVDDKGLNDINGSALPYNPQHVYRVRIQGQGKPIVSPAMWVPVRDPGTSGRAVPGW